MENGSEIQKACINAHFCIRKLAALLPDNGRRATLMTALYAIDGILVDVESGVEHIDITV